MSAVHALGPGGVDEVSGDEPGNGSRRVVAVAGFNPPASAREAHHKLGIQREILITHHPQAEPPYPYQLLRVEQIDGSPLSSDGVKKRWHQPPYVLALRLSRYAARSTKAVILDFAVIGARGTRHEFVARVERTATRLVEDAIVGVSRGATGLSVDMDEYCEKRRFRSGWVNYAIAKWRMWLFSEWWSVGVTTMPLAQIVRTGQTGTVRWLFPDKAEAWFADPFPWPGTNRLLCEEKSFIEGKGRIVALEPDDDGSWHSTVILDRPSHHSYPCTIKDGENTYFLPEATDRGATTLYRLASDGELIPVCAVAPGRRLGDPTLFRSTDRYWIAYTDLDFGLHDNLCLLHAFDLTGPWRSHHCYPVKIDVSGARPAGTLFRLGRDLFRPGQDCARTYGGGIVIHRIDVLTPERYHETVVARLRPNPQGPFPDGLHTLAQDGERVWLDGKRLVLAAAGLRRKAMRRIGLVPDSGRNVTK
jgi:hypothetical protein